MNRLQIATLVEGDGEVAAVPVLIRRIIQEINPAVQPRLPRPFRHPSGSILKPGGLENAINAVARLHPDHSILVLIDLEDDCPKVVGAELHARAKIARPDLRISIVLAHREYETWFLAAAGSLANRRGLPADLVAPSDPESIRGAKEWLNKKMTENSRYSPTQDQAALTSLLDLQLAHRRSRSFRKLWKETERLMRLSLTQP